MTNHNPKQTQTKKSSTQAAPSMGHAWALIALCSLGRQPQPQPPISRCLIHPTGRNKEGMTISLVVLVISFRETWGSGTSPPHLLCKKQCRSRRFCVCYQPSFLQAANAEVCTQK